MKRLIEVDRIKTRMVNTENALQVSMSIFNVSSQEVLMERIYLLMNKTNHTKSCWNALKDFETNFKPYTDCLSLSQ